MRPASADPDVGPKCLSIIVPAFNEERLLAPSLAKIKKAAGVLEARGWQWEMVVCDNHSTDRTAAIAAEAGARVVFEAINQIGRARNRGAEAATGDWLLFVDADSQPSEELFSRMLDGIESGRWVALGTTLQFDQVDWLFALMAWIWKGWSVLASHMAGAFIAGNAQAFRAIEGFSLEYYVGEELDLSRRLSRWGKQQSPRQRVRVLRGVPLLTSGRKAQLYSWGESARFLGQFILSPWATMKRKERCVIWYDGRR